VKRRILVLPFAVLVIASLTAWKLTRPPSEQIVPRESPGHPGAAPLFVLEDERGLPSDERSDDPADTSRKPRVRLATYLGRHRLLVAFFDGRAGVETDPVLLRLREKFPEIDARGTKIFAVGTAPREDFETLLQACGPFPFPLLRDPNGFATEQWGRAEFDEGGQIVRTRPGLFVVDRAGKVLSHSSGPKADDDPLRTIDALARGDYKFPVRGMSP
jgi:peroxiredoxin